MSGRKRSRILPREAGAAPLDVVIGVMAFLAVLSLGGVLVTNRMAETWQSGLSGRLTVQILPQGDTAPDAEVAAALVVLRATPGIARAAPISDAETLSLVEPWLGHDAVIAELPFPRLIDVTLAPGESPDIAALEHRLKLAAPHAGLDDHSRWIARLRTTAGTVVWSALAVLILIAVATAATVAFATRAGLATHHQIVELLHLMGARDNFISRAFERHYFGAALMASAFGALAALLIFLAAGSLEQVGFTSFPFLPPLGLRLIELPWLLLVPAGAAVIAWVTARVSVFSVLREIY